MAGSTLGTIFKISTWGESHGKAVGVIIDGCPAGLHLSESDIQPFLNRRKPGQSIYSTPRNEDDAVEILSGVFEGKTTGTPISMIVYNKTQQSKDYREIASYYRPGHADYTFDAKYGFRDYRGGGRSSGRETTARVAAGAVAVKILNQLGITFTTYTRSIGPVTIDYSKFDEKEIFNNKIYMPDANAAERAGEYIIEMTKAHDSVGGCVEAVIKGVPAGLGDTVFEKLDANLAKAVMSIGAVKCVEIGDGKQVSLMLGSEDNDGFFVNDKNQIAKTSNHAGGILGGMSDGSDILLRASFKATPSILKNQRTVNQQNEEIEISIKGRHDPVIVPRAVVVVEAMSALTILDALLVNMSATMDGICGFYHR
ncbi:MAG: chorismate synthase [Bacteroidales bacterium]|nr:chorismate synthase [Clostridium sp.]MCM1203117.1 chorismate synthase [Bacteroidales bacterium]